MLHLALEAGSELKVQSAILLGDEHVTVQRTGVTPGVVEQRSRWRGFGRAIRCILRFRFAEPRLDIVEAGSDSLAPVTWRSAQQQVKDPNSQREVQSRVELVRQDDQPQTLFQNHRDPGDEAIPVSRMFDQLSASLVIEEPTQPAVLDGDMGITRVGGVPSLNLLRRGMHLFHANL